MSTTINIPTSWDQITVGQFLELQQINLNDFQSDFYVMLEKLAIITNTSADDEEWEEMDVIEVSKLIQSRLFLNQQPPLRYKQKLGDDFIVLSFNDLTLGEFIDLDHYLTNDIIDNFPKILSILYRKYKIGEWNETIIEPYSTIDKKSRVLEFEDLPITDVYGVVDAFIKWKNDFMDKYEALWEPDIEDSYSEDELKRDPSLRHEIEKEKKEEAKHRKWGWIKLIYNLADGDMLKIRDITGLKLVYIFNILAMKKELGLIG